MGNDTKTLEKGNIYFFYRPKVEHKEVSGEQDVQRMYMVLNPDNKNLYRIAIIGKKELPEPQTSGHKRYWGYISMVSDNSDDVKNELRPEQYKTATRGERYLPYSRPFGEGVYRIVKHDRHTHFAYALELPGKTGEVQDEFNVEDQASYIISIKNPQVSSPPGARRPRSQKADYPRELENVFRDRRFSELDPPELINYEGSEFILIAASADVKEELGINLKFEAMKRCCDDIFKDLHLDISEKLKDPLFKGKWK